MSACFEQESGTAEQVVVGCGDGRVYLWNVRNSDDVTEICKHGDSVVYLSAIMCDGSCNAAINFTINSFAGA